MDGSWMVVWSGIAYLYLTQLLWGIFMFIARRNCFISMPITQNETFQAERAEIICRNKGGKEGVMTAGFDQSSNFAIADPSALCPASMKF